MIEEKLVVIQSFNTLAEAEIAKSILASGGIEATLRNEYASALYPTIAFPVQLVVLQKDEASAREVLNVR